MDNLTLREMKSEEEMFSFRQTIDVSEKSGLIGYVRGDFGKNGNEFHSSWFEHTKSLNTNEFKQEIDEVINSMRSVGGLLENRAVMMRWYKVFTEGFHSNPLNQYFFFRGDSDKYSYFIRCNKEEYDYDFVVYAYTKKSVNDAIASENNN